MLSARAIGQQLRIKPSNSGARGGWSRESLAGSAQKVLNTLIGDLRFE
mgnify:CR=1 FL=1